MIRKEHDEKDGRESVDTTAVVISCLQTNGGSIGVDLVLAF